ncbi:SusC/RagA family TonB-linked outer membrane protein [Daejeonella oryzae]|uniref:SusC/RagA family TonB-linked outer membrane protein n=1 Tax=Daejeonella oryzae TaxID=1122943 RepID=UPI0004082C4D|nr:SusC/RagA family TonB-linked outer membrane protein [Daejeonella oryzae]
MKYVGLILFLFLPFLMRGQELIRAKVISAADKLPLAGASISTTGSKARTLSKRDGTFSLAVSGRADTLKISFVGYRDQFVPVMLPLSAPLLIELTENNLVLDEVKINTGYYELPGERVTGSFTLLDNKSLNRSTAPDIISRLKGVSNAVLFDERVDNNRSISIRGLSTIYGDTQPLIVLNNFPYEGGISSINPNDVESITILKDAAAASIWGVRAANGVLVITTKKGGLNSPARVSFNSAISMGRKPDMFYRPAIASADFIEVEKMLFENDFYSGLEGDPAHSPLTPVVELLIAARDGKITAADADQQINALKQQDVRNDFSRYLYRNSVNQQYALNLQGGSDKNTYYYSAGYDRNTGHTDNSYERFSLRADHTNRIGTRLRIKPALSYSLQNSEQKRPDFSSITSGDNYFLYPYARLADDAGNPLAIVKNYRTSFIQQAPGSGLLDYSYLPLSDYRSRENNNQSHELLMSAGAVYDLSKSLSAEALYQYNRNWAETGEMYGGDSFYARDMVNRFTQLDENGSLTFPVPRGGILDQSRSALVSNTGRGQLKYQKDYLKHTFSGLMGAEIRQLRQEGHSFRTYGYDSSGLVSVPVDYTSLYTLYTNPDDSQGIPYQNEYTRELNRYTSIYANTAYTYDQKYTLSLSARKDASNLFGVNSNQKGVPLWSAGLSWNVHQEKFFKSRLMDYLKLRLTYGYNGNLSRSLSALATVLQVNGNLNNMPYALIRTYPNPDLSWEKIGILNAGLDFKSGSGLFSGTIEYYRKNGKDLIGDQAVDPTSGVISGTIRKNVADMVATGLDITLNVNTIDRAFKWNTGLLFNVNSSRITSGGNNTLRGYRYINGGLGITPVKGRPVQSIYTYKWGGLDPQTGDPRGIEAGALSADYGNLVYNSGLEDLEYHGPATPVTFGSVANTFSYKGLSLFVNISYRLGYYFTRPSISYNRLYNSWTGHADFAERWQKPGDESRSSVPSMIYPADETRDEFYTNSSALVEKGDNLRVQDVNLTYSFNDRLLKAIKIRDFSLNLNLRNPGFIWRSNKLGLDPDYTGFTPQRESLAFGIKANF